MTHTALLDRLNGPIPSFSDDRWLLVDQAGVIALMREAAAALQRRPNPAANARAAGNDNLLAKKVRATRAKFAIK